MPLAHTLLRAAHARGTHHFLALDALAHLTVADAEGWQRLFHAEIATYVDGAKAPDDAFKDFQNHVLHPRYGFWGGAPAQARVWYDELVDKLRRQDWAGASYAAGVLSHYCTDPLMPLHTHQTDAESNIHAAVERTISKSYARLREMGLEAPPVPLAASGGTDWLGDLLRAGARHATGHYETILAHYDIKRGVVSPEEGLDPVGQRAIAEMVVIAARMFATVLDRAVAEAAIPAPDVSLTARALQALASLPKAWWKKRQLDRVERVQIEAMYDELMATGRVEAALTEDERHIRARFQDEVVAKRDISHAEPQMAPVTTGNEITVSRDEDPIEEADLAARAGQRVAIETPRPAPRPIEAPTPRPQPAAAPAAEIRPSDLPQHVAIDVPTEAKATPVLSTYRPSPRSGTTLSLDANVVDAPSIGPKTAKRLNDVGIDTIGDFLKSHPIALAARLETAHITPDVLTEWQDQTRLMLRLPGLRATHAQLLTGSGYRSVEAIADIEPDKLAADILHFALSTSGQRVLRQGDPPAVEQIRAWAESARAAKAA